MVAPVDVVNRALSLIGARSTIANLDLEQSAEAKQARLLYAPTRDAMLRAAHWGFAKRTDYLSLLKAAPGTPEATDNGPWNPQTMPAPPWLYEYAYPSDCLLVRYVASASGQIADLTPPIFSVDLAAPPASASRLAPFAIASGIDANQNPIRVVLTNAREAIATYTARIEAPELWDAGFHEALVAALASRLCIALTGNLELGQRAAQQALQALFTARTQDGNEGPMRADPIPDWLAVRGVAGPASAPQLMASWVTPSFLGV